MKSLFEKLGVTYRQEGDYFVPNIELPESKPIGKYGLLRETFLKKQRNYLYNTMLMDGTLNEHLYEIDQTAKKQVADLVEKIARTENISEELKEKEPLKWTGLMNNIRHCYVQFKEDNPSHMKAIDFLKNKRQKTKSTYADIITNALLKYAETLEQTERDPYFETRKKENEFIADILSRLQEELRINLPSFMISLIATFTVNTNGGNVGTVETTPQFGDNIDEDDIDWELLESLGT